MTNKEIARSFDLLAKIMELHDENPFKIKSYQNAYLNLRKLDTPLSSYTLEGLMEIKGVGEAIAEKIMCLIQTGSMPTLEKYLAKTPKGVVEMLKINGLGPKKVAMIWKEMEITSPGELLYACNENRLADLKGFGAKTQESIIQAIGFLQTSAGKYLHTTIQHHGNLINEILSKINPDLLCSLTGPWRLGHPALESLELLSTCTPGNLEEMAKDHAIEWTQKFDHEYQGIWNEFLPVTIHLSSKSQWASRLMLTTGPASFIIKYKEVVNQKCASELDGFEKYNKPYVPPELRETPNIESWSKTDLDQLIRQDQIRGIIHCHSTYSDGIHSLEDMATAAKKSGFEYLTITDHSQAAAYARGLKPDQLKTQWAEIGQLNKNLGGFRIIKGIECDILASGELDYNDKILSEFELVIASIHSAFQMDKEKATKRLIQAIENPYTNILGHPSGRLLLSREGYPLDMKKIIHACKANKVAIELNANPQRLDLDYSFIKDCMDQGVFIAINPDAHNKTSIQDIQYGVLAARKGLLTSEFCLNAKTAEELLIFCRKH